MAPLRVFRHDHRSVLTVDTTAAFLGAGPDPEVAGFTVAVLAAEVSTAVALAVAKVVVAVTVVVAIGERI